MPTTADKFGNQAAFEAADGKGWGALKHLLHGLKKTLPETGAVAIGIGAAFMWYTQGDVGVSTAVASVLGSAKAITTGIAGMLADKEMRDRFDADATRHFMHGLEQRSRDVFSARRGTAWIVSDPEARGLEAMTDREYAAFKRELASKGRDLDEIVADARGFTVQRFSAGRLGSGNRALPSVERYELREGNRIQAVANPLAGDMGLVNFGATRFLKSGIGRMAEPEPEHSPAMGM